MRLALLFIALTFAPLSAFADCAADFAKIHDSAKPDEQEKLNNPRGQALMDKTKKLLDQHNESECTDMIRALHHKLGRS